MKLASSNIFGGQRRRAEKAGATLDFNLIQLRLAVLLRIGTNCEHCQQPITVRNFSGDHREPTSRGGSFSIRNTDVVCKGNPGQLAPDRPASDPGL